MSNIHKYVLQTSSKCLKVLSYQGIRCPCNKQNANKFPKTKITRHLNHLLKDQPFLDFRKITAYISRTSYTKSFKTIAERVQNELQVQQGINLKCEGTVSSTENTWPWSTLLSLTKDCWRPFTRQFTWLCFRCYIRAQLSQTSDFGLLVSTAGRQQTEPLGILSRSDNI